MPSPSRARWTERDLLARLQLEPPMDAAGEGKDNRGVADQRAQHPRRRGGIGPERRQIRTRRTAPGRGCSAESTSRGMRPSATWCADWLWADSRRPLCWAMGIGLEIIIVLLLIVVNGVFSMSELALASVRRARLAVLERKGVAGATTARELAGDPQRFLPTVQIGITLVSMLTGVFGGARIAGDLRAWLATMPTLGVGGGDAVAGAGGRGDDLPDPGAGRTGAEAPRAAPAGAHRSPCGARDRLDGAHQRPRRLAARQVVRRGAAPVRPAPRAAPDGDRGGTEGAARRGRAGRGAGDRGARHDRAPVAAGRQAGARDHDAAHRDRLDRPHRSAAGRSPRR